MIEDIKRLMLRSAKTAIKGRLSRREAKAAATTTGKWSR
jgi:hypothetical protein